MIQSYNRRQILLGCVNLFASVLGSVATYAFFRFVLYMVVSRFHWGCRP